ncbi:hypothetical protein E2542_SST11136 [Spatholobus suberectus]|nr:hypothetical protein E2542_SST11136 [Spatholobus suberectus]
MKSVARSFPNMVGGANSHSEQRGHFQMPLHYPRYTQTDYETMLEWRLDCLLKEYGLPIIGDLQQKRNFAIGAFLWSH